ncbi:MAG: C40 family peptidase, partial [Lachnospiraceae bacterium]|nr:C40 family peptidase [Lachnospiraceae bacterium]
MLQSADCSSYVRDVYKCFGLELPRNTTWQAAMPALKYDLSLADDDDKKELFDQLSPGAILFFKGHEMLYLGHEQDKYYVISATSSMMYPGGSNKARIRSVVINTLDEKRANGNTWLADLYEAAVPYVANDENVAIPVFKTEEEKAEAEKAANADKAETEAGADAPGEEQAADTGYEEIRFDDTWEY